jgi:type IV pilus assembly protein PilW
MPTDRHHTGPDCKLNITMTPYFYSHSRVCGQGRALRQVGFTLIELMVAMVIGLLIVLALITLLIDINRNNSEMSKTNRQIENGRYALQLLETDIVHAGYWGGFVPQFDDLTSTAIPSDFPTGVPDPCSSAAWIPAYKTNLIGIPLQGYEIPATVPPPTLSVCASKVVSPQPNTDVVFVRHAEQCEAGVGSCAPMAANEFYFQVARCGSTAPSPAYVLDNVAANFTLQNRDCTTSSEKRKYVSNLYYVRNYAVTPGDGIPTLMRSQFGAGTYQAAEVLIEGIDGFRVEYGVDNLSDSGANVNFAAAITWADATNKTSPTNRGDGIPDGAYIRCTTATPCTENQLANTVAVKVYVLARAEKETPGYTDTKTYALGSTTLGPFNDHFKRHLYSRTIRLTNVSSRRETP